MASKAFRAFRAFDNMFERIAKTGFYMSLFSYVAFWMMDILRPGFVSRSFSVHLFLLATVIFGIWWGMTVKDYTDRPWLQMLTTVAFGIILSVITWRFGEGFDALRPLMTLVAFFTPLLFWRLVRD